MGFKDFTYDILSCHLPGESLEPILNLRPCFTVTLPQCCGDIQHVDLENTPQ